MSNIKLTNSVKLAFESLAGNIDTTNVVSNMAASGGNDIDWTATADCFFFHYSCYPEHTKIDSVSLFTPGMPNTAYVSACGYLKSGAKFHTASDGARPCYFRAFGLK